MVQTFCWIAAVPRDGEREALLSAVAEAEDFRHDADHDGEVVITGHRGQPFGEELLESVADHVERAVLLSTTDEGPEVVGDCFERRDGDLERTRVVGGTSAAAVTDFVARERGIHGPV